MQASETLFRIKELIEGQPWLGPSISAKFAEIDEEIASFRVADKSIKRLLCHMIAYRKFFIDYMENQNPKVIEIDGAIDWPPFEELTGRSFAALREEFLVTQNSIERHLLTMTAEKWNTIVPGKSYNVGRLITGIVDHDIYHFGQITMIIALAKHDL